MNERLSENDVKRIKFSLARFGRYGYDPKEVDSFLVSAASRLYQGTDPLPTALTSADVAGIRFHRPAAVGMSTPRGFNSEEVDDFVRRVETEIRFLEAGDPLPTPPANGSTVGSVHRLSADDVGSICFRPAAWGTRSYDLAEVKLWHSMILNRFQQNSHLQRGAITSTEVQETVFARPRFGKRGCDADQVDQFRDLAVHELHLRERGQ